MLNRFTTLCSFFMLVMASGLPPLAAQTATDSDIVTYCIDPDWMPYEALRNGKHIGMSADYLTIISKLTGFKFQLVPTEDWQDTIAAVESGKCMVITMVNRTPSRSHFLFFSTPYLEVPNVIIGRDSTPMLQGFDAVGNRLVGIVSGFRHAEYLARYYPGILTEYVSSEAEGLEKLADGDIDLMVGSLMGVYSAINAHEFADLKIVGFAEPFDMLSFGVNKNYEALLPALNNAINQIPEVPKVEIYKRWNTVRAVKQTRYGMPLLFAFLGIALIGFLGWRKRVLKEYQREIALKNDDIEQLQSSLLERNRTLEFLSTRDEITGLYNRNYLLHKCEEEISRYHRFHSPASLIALNIMMDNKPLKAGSKTDQICKKLANCCLSSVRDVDIAARSEPDKFVILCPQSGLAAAQNLANRLLEMLLEEGGNTLAFHIGVAELQAGQSYSDWTDDLYRAVSASRRQGGNCVALSE